MENLNRKYLLDYSEVQHESIQTMLNIINETDGINLIDLKVLDLSYHNGIPIYPGTGVYLFREAKTIKYVGKCSSMSFTERISKHFDIRHNAWMNRLLKMVCLKERHLEIDDENLKIASRYTFDKYNLVLINFCNRDRLDRTERLLRACTKPLNKFRRLQVADMDKLVNEY